MPKKTKDTNEDLVQTIESVAHALEGRLERVTGAVVRDKKRRGKVGMNYYISRKHLEEAQAHLFQLKDDEKASPEDIQAAINEAEILVTLLSHSEAMGKNAELLSNGLERIEREIEQLRSFINDGNKGLGGSIEKISKDIGGIRDVMHKDRAYIEGKIEGILSATEGAIATRIKAETPIIVSTIHEKLKSSQTGWNFFFAAAFVALLIATFWPSGA